MQHLDKKGSGPIVTVQQDGEIDHRISAVKVNATG